MFDLIGFERANVDTGETESALLRTLGDLHDRAPLLRIPSRACVSPALRPDGVFERLGQTEASVDLARLAGLHHAAVICEIMLPVMLNNSLGSICLLRSRRSWLHEAGQEWNGRSQRERSVDTSKNKAPLKI